jgi:hypothetical protein
MRLLLVVIVVAGLTARVQAQQVTGGPIQQVHPCVVKIGPNTLNFSFYQPLKSRDQFCEDVPEVGPTIIVIDSMQDELRDMTMELRVLKGVGGDGEAGTDGQTVEAYLPPAQFQSGTIQYLHDFSERGNYVALVRARDQDGSKEYNGSFSFSVGEASKRDLIATSFLTASALGAFWLWFRRKFRARGQWKA